MSTRRWFYVLGLLASQAGCDQLFPELTGADNKHDLAVRDASSDMPSDTIHGTVCHLADLRAPSSCTTPVAGRAVTIQETHATTTTDASGAFSLSAAGVGSTATIAVTDPQGTQLGQYMPTVSVLTGNVLTAATSNGALLPVIDEQSYSSVALTNGATADDATRGSLIGWVIGPTGTAVAGAVATRITSAIGPLYDTNDGAQLESGSAAGTYGTIAFMDMLPGTASITVAPPSGSGLSADTFTMPIYGGAVTVGALALP